jgi:hypothetical protein
LAKGQANKRSPTIQEIIRRKVDDLIAVQVACSEARD